jgi:predicted ATPase/class 3 adenylate cyclase
MATTTFLFTDIEGSTRLWEDHGAAMRRALADHDRLLLEIIDRHHGRVFAQMGDGVAAAFSSAEDALQSAAEIQQGVAASTQPEIGSLKLRIGIHSGEVEERDGDFFGPAVNRAARIMAAGHGGQVLVSDVTGRLAPTDEFALLDLGEHRLRDLGRPERIHQLLVPGLPADFPRLRTLTEARSNLPVQLTTFVGRDAEVAEVLDLLERHRLVTITGVGGVGKTRVALQAAAEIASDGMEEAWFVQLGTVADPEGVAAAFLDSLGVPQASAATPRAAVVEHLAGRRALLVVDNCEHLIDEAASLIVEILTTAGDVRVLATSRELLGVPGEAAFGLRSLARPQPAEPLESSDAGRLLLDRAATAKPGFRATGHEEALIEICRRLDGIPLAIELAAARLRTFSPERVAGLLDEGFRLLTGGARTAVPRQRTLEATVEWSHRLLDGAEQALFRRLAAFSGGFTLEAVREICTAGEVDGIGVLDLLPSLVDKSLVVVDDDPTERFHLLETIRQFASARLDAAGEADTFRRRHAEYFRTLVDRAAEDRWGPQAPEAIRRVRAERDNLRQAMTWALETGEGDLALALALGFSRFRNEGEWTEPLTWTEKAIAVAGDPPDEITGAIRLHRLAVCVAEGPDTDRAVRLWEEAIATFARHDDGTSEPAWLLDYAYAISNLAVTNFYRGEGGDRNEAFRSEIHRALSLARRIGDKAMIAASLGNLAHHVDPVADPREVRELFAEAEQAQREVGSPALLAGLLWQRARYEFYADALDDSIHYWQSAIRQAQEGAAEDSMPRYRLGLALAALERGDILAGDAIREAIHDIVTASDTLGAGGRAIAQTMLVALASAEAKRGKWDRVALALGASDAEIGRGVPVPWDLSPQFDRTRASAREALGNDRFAEIHRAGRLMTEADIVEFLTTDF